MKNIKTGVSLSIATALLCTIAIGHPVQAECHDKASKKISQKIEKKDIVDTAQSAGSFNTLVTALKEAKLVDTLKSGGPFTVFAPTDEAFAKIDKDALSALLKDRAKLAKVLTYHVVPGNLEAKDVVKKSSAKTVEGSKVPIVSSKDGVKVGGAKVIKTDILCSNGVVHVIDTVIMPPAK